MKKILAVVAIAMFGIIFPDINPLHAESKIIKVRVSDLPNYSYRDARGIWTGLEVELARALITEAGYRPEFFPQPWGRGLESIRNGDIHIIPGCAITEDRKAFMLWIGPMYRIVVGLIVKKGTESMPIASLDDMLTVAKKQGKKYGYIRDTFWSKAFNDRLKNDPEFASCFETISQQDLNVRKTIEGRILGFVAEKQLFEYRIQNDAVYSGLASHTFILDSRPTYFGISKKGVDPQTLNNLYAAYEKLTLDGTIKKIRAKWNY